MNFTWTDAGAVAIIFYIVVKLLREIRAFIEIKNGKKIPGTLDNLPVKVSLSEHCRNCHGLLGEIRAYQESLDKYLPVSVQKAFDKMITNQNSTMKCQKKCFPIKQKS